MTNTGYMDTRVSSAAGVENREDPAAGNVMPRAHDPHRCGANSAARELLVPADMTTTVIEREVALEQLRPMFDDVSRVDSPGSAVGVRAGGTARPALHFAARIAKDHSAFWTRQELLRLPRHVGHHVEHDVSVMLVETRDLRRGDLVVERDGERLLAPFIVLRTRWYGDHLCTLSVLVLENRRMIGGCSFGGTEQLGMIRPDFDPVIEHYRATFAKFVAERGL